jgi:restriction system protein
MLVVLVLIDRDPPGSWQDLEARVANVLADCGYDVEVQKNVPLVRGDVDVDVWADDHSVPPNVIIVECKHWVTPATKSVVHAFRSVVGDSGANTGLLVSTAGFQSGAVAAAQYSNVRLINWVQFQELFASRWLRTYMAPLLQKEVDPLIEYTEPINSRIFRKADALSEERRERFKQLRDKYFGLGLALLPLFFDLPGQSIEDAFSALPLRSSLIEGRLDSLPAAVLDAPALRPLTEALCDAFREAISEFDEVFGERA